MEALAQLASLGNHGHAAVSPKKMGPKTWTLKLLRQPDLIGPNGAIVLRRRTFVAGMAFYLQCLQLEWKSKTENLYG